jgi:hypothetical protein
MGASYRLIPQGKGCDIDRNLGRALMSKFTTLDIEDKNLLCFLDGYCHGADRPAEVEELIDYLTKHGPCILKESW